MKLSFRAVEQILQQAKDPRSPARGLAEAGAASGSAVPEGGKGGAMGTGVSLRTPTDPALFIEAAAGSSWDFGRIFPKSRSKSRFGSFSTALNRTRQILLLSVGDNGTLLPPPFLGNGFKRSLILLTNQAISFAKQLQGPSESGGPGPLLDSGFW